MAHYIDGKDCMVSSQPSQDNVCPSLTLATT